MIAINLDKARAIARQLAQRVIDPAQRQAVLQAIEQAADTDALTAICQPLRALPHEA